MREKDLEGMPKVRMETPTKFFQDMESEGGPDHTYVGELYFSAHRGVFTSQAAVNARQPQGELALREAEWEMWGTMAMLGGAEYPLEKMDAAWKLLLLNQFHDILPGSCIGKVYELTHADHARIQAEAGEVRDAALEALTAGDGATVFNSLSFARHRPGRAAGGVRRGRGHARRRGSAHPEDRCGRARDGHRSGVRRGVAQAGGRLRNARTRRPRRRTARASCSENAVVRAVINARGEVVSFVDRETGREFAGGAMNRLLMYKDVPRLFDAWDIDSNYILQPVAIDEPVTVTIAEAKGLRAVVHVERKLLNSTFAQDIVLEAGSRRIDFVTRVDWHELHRLLKVHFPVAVQATEAINEIQFGYMTRPTHRSRLYDSDRFEVCNQRYSALCDASHGAAVLNDLQSTASA